LHIFAKNLGLADQHLNNEDRQMLYIKSMLTLKIQVSKDVVPNVPKQFHQSNIIED